MIDLSALVSDSHRWREGGRGGERETDRQRERNDVFLPSNQDTHTNLRSCNSVRHQLIDENESLKGQLARARSKVSRCRLSLYKAAVYPQPSLVPKLSLSLISESLS